MMPSLPPDDASPPSPRQYQLADLTMAGAVPYWAVHALDEDGSTSSWILHARQQDEGSAFAFDIWIPGAIQAIVADNAGHVWAITATNQLVTNAPVAADAHWSPVESHPAVANGSAWHCSDVSFGSAGVPRPELSTCMLWADDTLLIGTFNRCLYRWDGKSASVEYDPQAPFYSGGINDIVMTTHGIYALGDGGTVVQRSANGTWSQLDAPWSKDEAKYVNIVAGVAGPGGELWAIASGGWVLAAGSQGLQATHHIPAEPLGITAFQDGWYASTLDGCYQLMGAGHVQLIKPGIAMGKAIDAGTMLMAVDADPQEHGKAGAHVWVRTRSAERWSRRTVG